MLDLFHYLDEMLKITALLTIIEQSPESTQLGKQCLIESVTEYEFTFSSKQKKYNIVASASIAGGIISLAKA